ncbi:glycosyltransferase family 9 protein [Alteromonas sp. ASW11-130]|uniref:glycosyltransferase family 9 protein n=1 Tax=Alteromonas sp. ASW11-130 TaxID=3015775 RepID=UPI002242B58C|nr:glycosyltransferase family 9 protein [Alteromonas sp. ASW11-130]MCW8091177.1 glycosyltransferase family 9 protein [Alteromonas sp. ASW11-130]
MRLSAIGDVCHAAAMVNRIQRHWPDTEITWVIGKIEYQLVRLMPNIRFVVYDKKEGKEGVKRLKAMLADTVFDALLVMQVALRANLVSTAIKAKRRIGFDWHRSKELHWLFTNQRISARKHAHVLDGFMGFADALGVPKDAAPQWHIPLDHEAKKWAAAQAKELGQFVIISPAASKQERSWLPERYARIVEHLFSKSMPVVLCGGPGKLDKQTAEAILSHTDSVARNYVGETSLHQLQALIKHARLVIAPDTGPAHMATTVGTPVVGLYAHSNPRRTGPYNDLGRVVSVYDECVRRQYGKNWETLPWGIRAKGEHLMEKISEQAVIDQLARLLEH